MTEHKIKTEAVKVPGIRKEYGNLTALGESIRREGMHRPIVLWSDGTVLDGARRLRACILLGREDIPAEFVGTIEEAVKALMPDPVNDELVRGMKWSEICRLWELLRNFDAPAAVARADAHRRRGVELRRQTQDGKREPGRAGGKTRSEDYALNLLAEPFGISGTTAKRLWAIHSMMTSATPADRREMAVQAMADIDAGNSSIWANYRRMVTGRAAPISQPPTADPAPPAPGDRQLTAWMRSLPELEGLTAGLAELGPPNPSLLWEQIHPAYVRLMAVRRDLEKIIKKMRESKQS